MYETFNGTDCYECVRGFCGSCLRGNCLCSHVISEMQDFTPTIIGVEETQPAIGSNAEARAKSRVRSQKPNEHVEDPESTGRKRDARLFPLNPDKPCEWCKSNSQQKHLHFPDTDPLNNEPQNVHRVCTTCYKDAL